MEFSCSTCSASICATPTRQFTCAPCTVGLSPSSLTCEACELSHGIFVKTQTGWTHFVCAVLLGGEGSKEEAPINYEEILHDTFNLRSTREQCFVCKAKNHLATITCCRCERWLHFACLFRRKWKWISGVVCGCKKGPRNAVRVAPVRERSAIACVELENLIQPIMKVDRVYLFSKDCPYTTDTLPEQTLATTMGNSPMFVDCDSMTRLSWVVGPSDEPSKRAKLELSHYEIELLDNIILPTESKDMILQDFASYEDSLITDLEFLIQTRVREMYYFSLNQFLQDFRVLCLRKLKQWPCEWGKRHINFVWERGLESIQKHSGKFRNAIKKDWELCRENLCSPYQVKNWNTKPFPSRSYETIDFYVAAAGEEDVLSRLLTSKRGNCDGLSCDTMEGMGSLDLVKDTWASLNTDRQAKVECTADCSCDPDICLNRAIANQKIQKLGVEVVERETWGFDKFTYINLLFYCRQPVNDIEQNRFISKTLTKAINAVQSDNWDIRLALRLILESPQYTLLDKRYAQGLFNVVEGLHESVGAEEASKAFRIHPKGTGVVCVRPEGIKERELIIEYFGELYSPARWYEKQDVIKQMSKKSDLPDFYNIMLERHADDPDGYDTVMVDPIVKGSFASRLSHSCNPNCGTVVTVTEGRYTIGMYALANIEFGEELTFDYHSTTESKEEQDSAICLCATPTCRGYYLIFSKVVASSKYLSENYTFLHRMASLLKVCDVTGLTAEDYEVLREFNFGRALLNQTPVWLQAWCASTLNFVRKEMQATADPSERRNWKDSRVQNLAITVDKIKYALKSAAGESEAAHPPMARLSEAQVFEFYWGKESLRSQLLKNNADNNDIKAILERPCSTIIDVKKSLLEVRDLLRLQGREEWRFQGVADILHLHVFTQIHFRSIPYTKFANSKIEVRYCDIMKTAPPGKELSDVFKVGKKNYSGSYIEGSLVGWFKQTVENPAASLSADKRGTLTLSCLSQNMTEPYPEDFRKQLLRQLRERPAASWTPKIDNRKTPWSAFTNSTKIHGSPMFDAAYFQCPQMLEECLDCIDKSAAEATEVMMQQIERTRI